MSSYSSLSPDSFAGGSAGISSSASASASTYSNVSFRSNSVPDSSSGNIPVVQNSCQLYMGDLNPEWSENDIKSIWSMLGEPNVQVKLIKSSNPNKSHSAQNSGYCFVEFANQVAARNALMKSGLQVPLDPNYVLKLNWASFATAPGTEFTIFVGDLAPNVTEAQLFELFISRYSSTLNAKIVFDQFTGVSKGYGFVKFVNEAEQQRALVDMQGVFLNGRAIRVGATSKNKYQQQQQQQQHHHHQNQHCSSLTPTNSSTSSNIDLVVTVRHPWPLLRLLLLLPSRCLLLFLPLTPVWLSPSFHTQFCNNLPLTNSLTRTTLPCLLEVYPH